MNKLAIFDLDGVLTPDLMDVHFEALNSALVAHGHAAISHADHLAKFDGLPTKTKLRALDVVGAAAQQVDRAKQRTTLDRLADHVGPDPALAKLLTAVHAAGYLIAVASNARMETVRRCLELLSVEYLVAWAVTPEDLGVSPKPSPAMHLWLMQKANACPLTTVIFEDAPAGLKAAHLSGAKVVQVDGKLDHDEVLAELNAPRDSYEYYWPELAVLLPAAGDGRRFKEAGYEDPKPHIKVNGTTMLSRVSSNLGVYSGGEMCVLRREHTWVGVNTPFETILDAPTRGTAETCLRGIERMPSKSGPLLIANCDQLLEWNHVAFHYLCRHTRLDGVVVTFEQPTPDLKWSYCELDGDGTIRRIAEKEPISTTACTGVWFWRDRADFVKYATQLIDRDVRVKNEFYVSQVYNLAIADGKKFGTFKADKFWSLGTPECLKAYLEAHPK